MSLRESCARRSLQRPEGAKSPGAAITDGSRTPGVGTEN